MLSKNERVKKHLTHTLYKRDIVYFNSNITQSQLKYYITQNLYSCFPNN